MELSPSAQYEPVTGAEQPWRLLALAASRVERDVAANEEEARKAFGRWTLQQFRELSLSDLVEPFGLDRFEAQRVLAAVELGKRVGTAAQGVREQVGNAAKAASLFRDLANERQEHFVAAYLDAKGNVLARTTVHKGTVTASLVGAREVFREAVKVGAASVIVAHNHPSGDPEPSPEDVAVTKTLVDAGELLDIPVLDHIVVGKNDTYVSLAQRGLMGR